MSLNLDFPFVSTLVAPASEIQWVSPKYMHNSANCELDLQIGLFFDGTNNNWKRDEPKLSHSNIVRLAASYPEDRANGFARIYVPGVGTIFPEIGDLEESGFGSGFAEGCEARILFALLQVFNCIHQRVHEEQPYFSKAQLKALCRNKSSPNKEDRTALVTLNEKSGLCMPGGTDSSARKAFLKKHSVALATRLTQKKLPILKEFTIDVFGFSRGAAEARVFCTWLSEVLSNGKLAGVPLTCRFLGIIDTVASAGVMAGTMGAVTNTTGGHDGWAKPENLRIPSFVENCVHMVAMHELRKNFPLDDIRVDCTMPENCQQFAYPGSHSDVGGGYGPGELGIAVGKTYSGSTF